MKAPGFISMVSFSNCSLAAPFRTNTGNGTENFLGQALHLEKTAYYELGRIGFPFSLVQRKNGNVDFNG